MADVEVTYNNNKIVELSESGTKTLKTAGKYCEGDIVLEYERPVVAQDDTGFLFGFQNTIDCSVKRGICSFNTGSAYYRDWNDNVSGRYQGVRSWTGLFMMQYSGCPNIVTLTSAAPTGTSWTLDFFADWVWETNDNCTFTIEFAGFTFVRKKTTLQSFKVSGTSVSLDSHTYSPASHMAFVYTGTELRIFENGSLISTKQVTLASDPRKVVFTNKYITDQNIGAVVLSNVRLVSKVLGTADSFPVPTELYTGDEFAESAPGTDIIPQKDGVTRFYLDIPTDCDFLNKLSIPLYWNQSVSEGVTIDWGDNSPTAIEKVSGTGNVSATPHTYAAGGRYIVTMTVDDGCTVMLGRGASGTGLLGDSSITANAVRMVLVGVETGSGVTTIQSYCFCRHAGIRSVYFGPALTAIQNYGFAYSWHLGGIHFLGTQLPANADIGSTNVWSEVPTWCKVWVPEDYIDDQEQPQNIPSRLPATGTYTYAKETDPYPAA